jgi:hypothetical protein
LIATKRSRCRSWAPVHHRHAAAPDLLVDLKAGREADVIGGIHGTDVSAVRSPGKFLSRRPVCESTTSVRLRR